MFIAVFNDAGDIYVINSFHRKHEYHQILQRRACLGKGYVNDGF